MMRLLLTLSIVVTHPKSEDDYIETWERYEIFQREPTSDEPVQLCAAGPYLRVDALRWTWEGQLQVILHGFAVGPRRDDYRGHYYPCPDDYINRESMQMIGWERVQPAEA